MNICGQGMEICPYRYCPGETCKRRRTSKKDRRVIRVLCGSKQNQGYLYIAAYNL